MDRLKSGRDFNDWVTLGIAITAILISIILPLSFRACDRKERIPQIDIKGNFLYSVTPQHFPELMVNVAKATPFIHYFDKTMSGNKLKPSDFIPSMTLYRKFELIVINKKSYPVSLTRLRVANVKFDTSEQGDRFWFDSIWSLSKDDQVIERNPVINLGPNEVKKIEVLVGYECMPSYESFLLNHKISINKFRQMLKDGTPPEFSIEEKIFGYGEARVPKTISESLQEGFARVVYLPVFEEYLAQINFSELQFVVSDYLGKDFFSNKIDSTDKFGK